MELPCGGSILILSKLEFNSLAFPVLIVTVVSRENVLGKFGSILSLVLDFGLEDTVLSNGAMLHERFGGEIV